MKYLLILLTTLTTHAADLTLQWDKPPTMSVDNVYRIYSLKILSPPRTSWPPAKDWQLLKEFPQVQSGTNVTSQVVSLQDDGRVMIMTLAQRQTTGTNIFLESGFSGGVWVHEPLPFATGLKATLKR